MDRILFEIEIWVLLDVVLAELAAQSGTYVLVKNPTQILDCMDPSKDRYGKIKVPYTIPSQVIVTLEHWMGCLPNLCLLLYPVFVVPRTVLRCPHKSRTADAKKFY
jgi:hypothetical protein